MRHSKVIKDKKVGCMRKRVFYFALVLLIIALGIISRRIDWVPLFVGDMFYAMMVFFIIKFLSSTLRTEYVTVISLSVCCIIEISQLYKADWINAIRSTLIGRLVLGRGFLWSDLIAYTFGVVLAVCFEVYCDKKVKSSIER